MTSKNSGSDENFKTVDNIIFLSCIGSCFLITIWTAFKNKSTTNDYFTASKSMGSFPIAMSILSSFIGSTYITGTVAEVYAYGMEVSIMYVGGIFGLIVCTFLVLKLFCDLGISTVFEYIELRYKSPTLRVGVMLTNYAIHTFVIALQIYVSSLIVETIMPISLELSILITGIASGILSTMGGIRGVIWTDTFMMLIIIGGIIITCFVGISTIGMSEIWSIARDGGRTNILNLNPSLFQRQNSYSLFIYGFIIYGKIYSTTQVTLQRARSLKSFDNYKWVLIMIASFLIISKGLLLLIGLIAYATYADCDPMTEGKIKKTDQILAYLVNDKMGHISGIPGIFLSALVAASLSTLSSLMNSLSNNLYTDLLCKFDFIKKLSERTSLLICRIMTLLTAFPGIGIAFLLSNTFTIQTIMGVIMGAANGPLLGLFVLALMFPTSNLTGAIAGFFSAVGVLVWMLVGRMLYGSKPSYLPFSKDGCEFTNSSLEELGNIFSSNNTLSSVKYTVSNEKSFYDVSYTFNNIFGILICVFVGMCVSYLTGGRNLEEVPKEHIASISRCLYYKKDGSKRHFSIRMKKINMKS